MYVRIPILNLIWCTILIRLYMLDKYPYCSSDVFFGQHTPGTNRFLKHIDCLRWPKLSNSCGQLLRSSQLPWAPSGVEHGLLSCDTTLPEPRLTSGFTTMSVTFRPSTFLLMVNMADGRSPCFCKPSLTSIPVNSKSVRLLSGLWRFILNFFTLIFTVNCSLNTWPYRFISAQIC